jgi:hypothetical protein
MVWVTEYSFSSWLILLPFCTPVRLWRAARLLLTAVVSLNLIPNFEDYLLLLKFIRHTIEEGKIHNLISY